MTKPFRVSEDVVPIGKFKAEAAKWLRRIAKNRRGIVITQNGQAAGVLLPSAEYDELMHRQRLLEEIAVGSSDADEGRTMTTRQLRQELRRARRLLKRR